MANTSSLKPITLYNHAQGANPWKVVITMKELDIPFESSWIDFTKIKSEPYISVNPNGRVPAIEDPNTGITLWESGAILQYLVERYDKEHKISFPAASKESHLANQWLFFQASGQGPYMGQAAWFSNFHHEKLPSAIERYQKETIRIVEVIDGYLAKHNLNYLVPDSEHPTGKFSFADISFVPWGEAVIWLTGKDIFADGQFPAYKQWMDRLKAHSGVKEGLELKAAAIAERK